MAALITAADLGIDTSTDQGLFDWLLASILFGRPVPQQTAAKAFRADSRSAVFRAAARAGSSASNPADHSRPGPSSWTIRRALPQVDASDSRKPDLAQAALTLAQTAELASGSAW